MKIYSYNGSYPQMLPQRIRLSDGTTRTDSSTYTEQEIADAGWIEAPPPPTVEYPNKLDWVAETRQWNARSPNDVDVFHQWENIRRECVKRLTDTDYKVIKSMESGTPPDPMIVTYRQQIRDIYSNVNDIDPWFVEWPAIVISVEE